MEFKKVLVLVALGPFLWAPVYGQTLDVPPGEEAEEQLDAFDEVPEREPRAAVSELEPERATGGKTEPAAVPLPRGPRESASPGS